MIIQLYNLETRKYDSLTLDGLLEMINRDRSGEWSHYNTNNTLKEITEIIDTLCYPYTTRGMKGLINDHNSNK